MLNRVKDLKHETRGEVDLLFLTGPLDNQAAAELKAMVTSLADRDRAKIVLDLGGVNFVDSSGLGGMVACLRTVTRVKGDLRLADLNPQLRSVFELTRLHRLFEIYPQADAAAASFS